MNYLVLSATGLATARRLQRELGGVIYGTSKSGVEKDIRPVDDVGKALRDLFAAGDLLVALCASGIVIRHLASELDHKSTDAAVISVAEDGSAIVPLLGGHHGANREARRMADVLAITPAITTASDVLFGVAFDEPPQGWKLANPQDLKEFVSTLRDGATLNISGQDNWLAGYDLPLSDDAALTITMADPAMIHIKGNPSHLVYFRQVLALGVGCERGASGDELIDLVNQTLAAAKLSALSLAGLFSIDLKMDEAAMHRAAEHFDVPARFFDLETLQGEEHRLANPSDIVKAEIDVAGVAEACALAATQNGSLLVEKHKGKRTTCAIAQDDRIIAPDITGSARGHLSIVSIGPGRADWRTPASERALRRADVIVGYSLYLELIADLIVDKDRHAYNLGEEEDRVRAAIELAALGGNVALVSSGDAGVYAMGALVHELLDRDGAPPSWDRISLELTPGVSAMQAAALRAGAPLGHDFCAISLSDLLTPRQVIVKRIEAAAMGDFVISFYNPVSRKRRDLLAIARDILRRHRPDDTPVILARNLGRPSESITVLRLKDLSVDDVDMLTLVMIGSSETKARKRGDGSWSVYTPRGYAAKHPELTGDAEKEASA
jgi:cobalt-precorrin 5A hydrolase/precorrin-3B C17-methyltransferase